jgi:acyl carrier protein
MDDEVRQLVYAALKDLGNELRVSDLAEPTLDTRLIGSHSAIDSLGLVSLIADLETRIADQYGVEVVLADERAMSAMRSPFRTAGALIEHIQGLIKESR